MKRQTRAGKLLDQFLDQFGNPPQQSMETSRERLLDRFMSGKPVSPDLPLFEMDDLGLERRRRQKAWIAATVAVSVIVAVSIALRPSLGVWGRADVIVEAADNGLSVVSGGSARALHIKDRIRSGERVRSSSGAVLSLADGSRLEMSAQSEFAVERAEDGIRIHLFKGGIIINAARQVAGHLYVQTKDVTVSVVGTVFLVNAEEEGSRVAVIEGEVRVKQGITTQNLRPGEQLSTNPRMEPLQVKEELSWSRNADVHVALLQQSAPASVAATPKKLEFEVATIKPVPSREVGMDIKCRGIDGLWSASFHSNSADAVLVPLGRCVGTYGLGDLLQTAYGMSVTRVSSSSLPRLISGNVSERDLDFEAYQLEGKAEDPRTATMEQLRQMVKNLVIDRFKLKGHVETREEDGYFLRAADGGVKFKETSEDEENWLGTGLRLQPRCYWCLKGKFSLESLADGLESFVLLDGKPVVNGTGLKGVYDIALMLYRVPPIPDGGPRGGSLAPREFNPSLSKSLEDQLGLRLERARVPVKHLVIEHIERPTGN